MTRWLGLFGISIALTACTVVPASPSRAKAEVVSSRACGPGEVMADGACAVVTCEGDNPQGCSVDADCSAGQHCLTPNPSDACIPSACACDPSSGWVCTADCSGGLCVAVD